MKVADEKQNELDWTAFLYVADELSSADREAFELRLADDQAAREAVARAVEVTQAAAHAAASVGVRPAVLSWESRSRRIRRLQWAAVGAAASLALVLMYGSLTNRPDVAQSPSDGGDVTAVSPNRELGELAENWRIQRTQASDEQWLDDLSLTWAEDVDSLEVSSANSDLEETPTLQAPTWMVAALAGMSQSGEPEADPGIQEN